jgi:hypothetical protein
MVKLNVVTVLLLCELCDVMEKNEEQDRVRTLRFAYVIARTSTGMMLVTSSMYLFRKSIV